MRFVLSDVVFVFTLDCNNCIYCYDTRDGFFTPAVWLITGSSLKCHWIKRSRTHRSSNTHTRDPRPLTNTYLSTVLAQDHFFSDFLSLHLTSKTHKVTMMMLLGVGSRNSNSG